MNELKLLYTLALGLLAGLFVSRLVKPLKLPAVTGYLIAGLLIGPYFLGRLGITGFFSTSEELASVANVISDVALGFIAFAIGTEFKLSALKHTGKQAVIIGIVQALAAMLLVDGALIGLHYILGPETLPLSRLTTRWDWSALRPRSAWRRRLKEARSTRFLSSSIPCLK